VELVIVLRIRRGKNAELSPDETERMAGSIQAQIDGEFGDKGKGRINLGSRSTARRLAGIIDEYTPI
jgi:hypothetical protein